MTIEKILEKEFNFTLLDRKPKIKLKVLCSCGKKYIIKEELPSWNQSYIRKAKCKFCGDVSYLQHNLSYPDEWPKYSAEVIPEKTRAI